MQRGKREHEDSLQKYIESQRSKGIKIIDLGAKSPDAIEAHLENDKIKLIAIEVLPLRWNKGKKFWKKTFTHKQKQDSYSMFDEVKIITYKLDYSRPRIV